MAAPQFVPTPVSDRSTAYDSPDAVPAAWVADRPAELHGRQPRGARLGNPGPDQGFGLKLAERMRDRVLVQPGEHVEDAIWGCLGVALRRASLFGRAPVIHDFTIAFTIWGFLDANPPAELVALRGPLFQGVEHVAHSYEAARAIVDQVPESTLRQSPDAVTRAYPAQWRTLLG
jgi:hypothetical protein